MERLGAMNREELTYDKNYEVDTRIIHIYGIGDVDIVCPRCWKIGKISVSNIPTTEKKYKLKCKCGETSVVKFEKRGNPRQNTTLIGVVNLNDNEYLVDITDLSIGGCSFVLVDNRCKLALRDKLRIRFKLDSPEFDLIKCSAIVRYFGERVDVEFVDLTDRVRKTLESHFNLLNS
jgi:hypothetical protein